MTGLQEMLGIRYPIIQGGMANIATGAFAAACSDAGALGLIGTGGIREAEGLRKEIHILRERTDKPFGVNLMLMNPETDKMVEICIEEKVPVVTTGAGNPGIYMEAFKAAGIKVIPVVPAPILAKRLEKLGADAVIAEGCESGGHIGEMTTMTLIYQVAGATDKPIIAGGGIGSGAQMLAAEVLGAKGVQIGTAFLFTDEVPVHQNYKDLLMHTESHRITSIGNLNGRPMRLVKNPMTREFKELERSESDKEVLEDFTLGRLRKAVFEGDVDQGSVMAGYTAAQFDRLYSVPELLEKLMSEYQLAKNSIK